MRERVPEPVWVDPAEPGCPGAHGEHLADPRRPERAPGATEEQGRRAGERMTRTGAEVAVQRLGGVGPIGDVPALGPLAGHVDSIMFSIDVGDGQVPNL